MASKVKEKFQQILPKDEIKCSELIEHFKNTLHLWFLYGTVDNNILQEVLNCCFDIIMHGLKNEAEKMQVNANIATISYDSSPTVSASANNNSDSKNNNDMKCYINESRSDLNLYELHKIIDDFEWVRNAVSVRCNSIDTPTRIDIPEAATALYNRQSRLEQTSQSTIVSHVLHWLKHNLNENNLCAFLQYLVSDKELLEEHYSDKALLRQELYVTGLVIGLTAFETSQYGLLSQIDVILKSNEKEVKQHKRSNSQPNVIIVSKPQTNRQNILQTISSTNKAQNLPYLPSPSPVFLTIRKTKSLPELKRNTAKSQDETDLGHLPRPRCKTIAAIKPNITEPQNIPNNFKIHEKNINIISQTNSNATTSSSGSILYEYDDNQPTTSQANSNRSKSPLSNYTLNSTKSTASSQMSTSVSSCNSNTTTKCIQLINTDDIKIWTDHTWEMKQKNKQQGEETQRPVTITSATPTPVPKITKSSKSLSPLNSFFSSLFSTPPSYTSWYIDHDAQTDQQTTETAIESIIPDSNHNSLSCSQQNSSLSLGTTVFEKFLPIDGKKLRSRKSQNLFEDINTPLDCSGINIVLNPVNTNISADSPSSTTSSPCSALTANNCQSLTRFLQMSHMSRNNTDLEKENAHFRISEAIISAIEHIKWNRRESEKDKYINEEATALATDCLSSSNTKQLSTTSTPTGDPIEEEHVPFAELEETSYDLLSAEVVGLSLISKFDEKQLPKVSELKWLVSDEDTPQKLLPMPDLTSSANPDEHVVHSATRGTRYWAPPRQQIIFTDHPSPNRKELLKKQNYRCAGCGMRVSPQYMQSFRYCTYFGKYNCTGCHRNQISATPAKILQAWDFKCYPVSVFAYRLLEQMYAYPLFYVPDLNPALYFNSKSLLSARNKRIQLKYVKDFIRMCRFALREQSYFETVPGYITADIDNWSMSDFVDARTKCLHRSIDELINKCENHIYNCVLCTARGFLCECCHADVIIYPWDSHVERCDRCGTCFHRICWKSMSEKCCRCQRFDKRQDEINDVI